MELVDLDDYLNYPRTNKCYLDGRYFNLVFEDYEGLIKDPLYVIITDDNIEVLFNTFDQKIFNMPRFLLMRVVIISENTKHANLLIFDKDNNVCYRFDPHRNMHGFELHRLIDESIQDYLNISFNFKLYNINVDFDPEFNEDCDISGYCVAYIIKYAYDFLLDRSFDPYDIRRFANKIESEYEDLLDINEEPDVEYGIFDDPRIRNAAIAGGISALAGGLLGGSLASAAVSGLAGGGITYLLSRNPNTGQSALGGLFGNRNNNQNSNFMGLF